MAFHVKHLPGLDTRLAALLDHRKGAKVLDTGLAALLVRRRGPVIE